MSTLSFWHILTMPILLKFSVSKILPFIYERAFWCGLCNVSNKEYLAFLTKKKNYKERMYAKHAHHFGIRVSVYYVLAHL